ncbi:DUF2971 domain-containing protein [Mycolicibacterium helvum]|uniref:DUF2971 domain-containing protein n=1 Tax=Mycolicibacterium helvum TaxID=1534349 RepID=A0A7I7TFV3_9MYCO|nr:DUF2971 domain-containing protein [Mycolicibacterium helvum]BBY67239.1 hypothetical protein MHEL_54820 [Mycolicibacterium helvum]
MAKPPKRGLPKTLYHYTDIDGFEGIYGSGELWGTHALYLNDASELKIGLDAVQVELDELRSGLLKDRPDGAADAGLAEHLEDVAEMSRVVRRAHDADCYIVSLSKNADQLSQWRAYAKSGYCIGFDTEALFQHFDAFHRMGLVNYYPDEHNVDIPSAMILLMQSQLEEMRENESIPDESREFWTAHFLAEKAAFMKDRTFVEEGEVRIVQAVRSDSCFFTPSKYGMTPRTKIPLAENAITTVIVGPGAHADLRLRSLSMYLQRTGFKRAERQEGSPVPSVVPSKIPYRDW